MASVCNIITISKLQPIDDDNVESSKIYEMLLSDYKMTSFINFIEEKYPEKMDTILNILKTFALDVVEICYSKVKDISIEISIDEYMMDLTINLKLLLSKNFQVMDQTFFNIAIELSDKYENLLLSNNISNLYIDFNTELKNEYTKIISYIDNNRV